MYPFFFVFTGGGWLTDCDWPFWLVIRVRNNHWNVVIDVKQLEVEIATLIYEAKEKSDSCTCINYKQTKLGYCRNVKLVIGQVSLERKAIENISICDVHFCYALLFTD